MDCPYLSTHVQYILHDIYHNMVNDQEFTAPSNLDDEILSLHSSSTIAKLLNKNELKSVTDFVQAVTDLIPVFKRWAKCDEIILKSICVDIHAWLPGVTVENVGGWISSLLDDNRIEMMVHLLRITAALERALGEVHWHQDSSCPFLLSELLDSSVLTGVISITGVKLLKVLLGGPLSLNLRNISWHGFVGPYDIPSVFFFALLITIGKIATDIVSGHFPMSSKPFVKKLEAELLITEYFHDIKVNNCINEILSVFESSSYIPVVMLPYFKEALNMFQNSRFGDCVLILLPQIEHTLRCRFAQCNGFPERVKTAESSEFYIILDDILSKTLKGGSKNEIGSVISDSVLEFLIDLFNLPHGLRLRDHISHGEMNTTDISEGVAAVVICCAVAITMDTAFRTGYHARTVDENIEKLPEDCKKSNRFLIQISSLLGNYESMFHPLAFAKRCASYCLYGLGKLKSLEIPPTLSALISSVDLNEQASMSHRLTIKCCTVLGMERDCRDKELVLLIMEKLREIEKTRITTLFRSDENEVFILLQQVSYNCKVSLEQIVKAVEKRRCLAEQHLLRSRQRKNFAKLLLWCPVFADGLMLLSCFLLPNIHSRATSANDCLVKRLKFILKLCENVASLTEPQTNKWDEAKELFSKLLEINT